MRIAVAGAAVLLLAGCGGAGSAAPPRPTVDRGAQLERYLDRMGASEQRFNRLASGVASAFDGVDEGRPGAGWERAAARLAPLSTSLNRLGGDISQLRPPRPLAQAHRRLAES